MAVLDPKQALAQARQHEKAGQHRAAYRLYLQAKAWDDAARILMMAKRYREAGELLTRHLGLPPGLDLTENALRQLDARGKKRALNAGICFSRAGMVDDAVLMFVGVGEIGRAAELLKRNGQSVRAAELMAEATRRTSPDRAGDASRNRRSTMTSGSTEGQLTADAARRLEDEGKHQLAMEAWIHLKRFGDAARMARVLGDTRTSAELFGKAGKNYESGLCYSEIGDSGAAIDRFTRVSRSSDHYTDAAIEAIRLASEIEFLNFQLENFVTRFLKEPPRNEHEAEAFFQMARLYVKHDHPDAARDAYRQLLDVWPNYKDARERLASLDQDARGSDLVYKRVLEDDAQFRKNTRERARRPAPAPGALPGLPDLPDLPGLPPTPGAGPARTTAQPAAARNARTQYAAVAPQGQGGATHVQRGTHPPPQPSVEEDVNAPTMFAAVDEAPSTGPMARQSGATAWSDGTSVPPPTSDAGAAVTRWTEGDTDTDVAVLRGVGRSDVLRGQGDSDVIRTPGESIPAQHPARKQGDSGWTGFEPGSVLSGRYRFEKKIGEGGMAAVFKAFDLELEEHIAIKIFTHRATDPNMLARFKQELSLSRRLSHPNIIRLYDIGSFEGFRYITMELLVGRDLNDYMGQPLEVDTALDWLIQACRGLQAAHDLGVIHRDIKPHNVFVCSNGQVKVMDFGIAKRVSAPGMTVGNFIAGTPEYMSPEQISGFSSVSHSTDIYALGMMAYQMFTGRLAFEHEEMLPLLMMQLNEAPTSPRELNPRLPDRLEQIILKLVEKKPEDRFSSCRALADALEQVRQSI